MSLLDLDWVAVKVLHRSIETLPKFRSGGLYDVNNNSDEPCIHRRTNCLQRRSRNC